MIGFLTFQIRIVSADFKGRHVGHGVDLVSVFGNADLFVEGVERESIVGLLVLILPQSKFDH